MLLTFLACVRAAIALVAVAYLPGVLALRLLRFRCSAWLVQLALSVALSLTFDMMAGALVNWAYPYIGISRPLSAGSVVATLGLLVAGLAAANAILLPAPRWYRWRSGIPTIRASRSTCLVFCLCTLSPFLAAFAASVYTTFNVTWVMILMLLLIMSLTIILGTQRSLGMSSLYPYALMTLALALLLARSLLSQYIVGWDVQWEYFFAERVRESGHWLVGNSASQLNSTLSVVVLPPILSSTTGISTTWLFKLIYPMILSLAPPVLYFIYRRIWGAQASFLAALFFIFLNVFYFALTQAARMEISTLFLVLIVFIVLGHEYGSRHAMLAILLVAGLTVSHYSSAFIFAVWLATGGAVYVLFTLSGSHRLCVTPPRPLVSFGLVALAFVLAYAWYAYTSNGITFRTGVTVLAWSWRLLASTLTFGTHNPELAQAASGNHLSPVQQVARYLYLGTSALVVLGYIAATTGKVRRIDVRYTALSTSALLIFCASLILPGVSIAYDTGRMYLQALVVLAPFFVVGVGVVVRVALTVPGPVGKARVRLSSVHAGLAAVVLATYLGFQVGLVASLTGSPSTLGLDPSGPEHNAIYAYPQDVDAALWLHSSLPRSTVYGDQYGWMRLGSYGLFPRSSVRDFTAPGVTVSAGSVVFLRYLNARWKQTSITPPNTAAIADVPLRMPHMAAGDRLDTVYDAGGSRVLLVAPVGAQSVTAGGAG